MAEALPVWSTTRAIVEYCWRERAFALRHAAFPLITLILLDVVGIGMGIDISKDWRWQVGTSLVSLLAYTPFIVTWYQKVAGLEQPHSRGLFTFGAIEWRVIMANVQVGLILGVALLLLIVVLSLIGYGVFNLAGQKFAVPTIVILSIPALCFWLVLFTRLSLVVAYAAAGEHISLGRAWKLTRGMGVTMTLVDILLLLVSFVPIGLIALAITAVAAEGTALHSVTVATGGTLGGVIYLTLFTTLYGVVYRKLNGRDAF